jgi:hypothetical protein
MMDSPLVSVEVSTGTGAGIAAADSFQRFCLEMPPIETCGLLRPAYVIL